METLPALRSRIDALSSAIEAQKKILRDLETDRSNARRQLNSVLDPMARLPLEVSSNILIRCLPNTTPRPNGGSIPMLFLGISHLWSNIAISTPGLWNGIHIGASSRGANFIELCGMWMERARTLPLALALDGSMSAALQTLVRRHAQHLKTLDLCIPSADDLALVTAPFPSLRKLSIKAADSKAPMTGFFTPAECVELLRSAPDLTECDFVNMFHAYALPTPKPRKWKPLTHTGLRRLRLGNPQQDRLGHNSARLLQNVTLPALKSLWIYDFDISKDEFVSFLKRSSPPLRSLHVDVSKGDWDAQDVRDYLRLLPNLTYVEVTCHHTDGPDLALFPFLEVLETSPDLLPKLKHLGLRAYFSDFDAYHNLITCLRARRAMRNCTLESVRVITPHDEEDIVPEGPVIEDLQKLAKGGLEVHVGSETFNFLTARGEY
ncbi:hypothetical protein C8R46DRAFT_1107716 [Mycena filopes]|nr:hypothetical protein C8R46DRAFT_1107716 [Mycena filopes]